MKVAYTINIAFILALCASCVGLKRVHRLIDQKEEFIWTGSDGAKNYMLMVDSVDGIWFTGKIIKDSQDTLYLKGFEKGSNHSTSVNQSVNDSTNSTSVGYIFIRTKGYTADTVRIDNTYDSIPQLPFKLVLFKMQRIKMILIEGIEINSTACCIPLAQAG